MLRRRFRDVVELRQGSQRLGHEDGISRFPALFRRMRHVCRAEVPLVGGSTACYAKHIGLGRIPLRRTSLLAVLFEVSS